MNKQQWIELCKTLGIFLLLFSAVFLAIKAFFVPGLTGKSFDHLTSEWMSLVGGQDQQTGPKGIQIAASPMRIVAISSEGKQCVQYNGEAVEAAFRQVAGQLGQALEMADSPEKITEKEFQAALQKRGYYFEWMEPVSLSLLCTWLNDNVENRLLSHSARQILLGETEGVPWLYYINDEDGMYYACRTGEPLKESLEKEESHFFSSSDTVHFLFETDGDAAADPYLICTDGLIALPVLEWKNPLETEEGMTQLLTALGFNEGTMSNYQVENGWVFKQDEDAVRFTKSGEVSYTGSGLKKFSVSAGSGAVTEAEAVEAARQMITQVIEPLCGTLSHFYLEEIQKTEKNTYRLTFGCQVEGVPVFSANGTCGIELQISGTRITALKAQIRQYSLSGEERVLVPERQALAALSGWEDAPVSLFVGYVEDGTGTLGAEWMTRQGE
jgi:hypothetical protein